MEVATYDSILGFIGSFSAFCTGITLVTHERRQRVHIALGLFFLNLSLAFFARSLNWQSDGAIHLGFAYSLFAVMPLLFCIFVENLARKPIGSKLKVAIVAAMTLFVFTTWFDSIRTLIVWKLAFMSYHVASLYLLLQPLKDISNSKNIVLQERQVVRSIYSVVMFGIFLTALEWIRAMTFADQVPRISSLAVLIFSHNLTWIYFNEHKFSLRKEIITIVSYLIFAIVAAQVLALTGTTLSPYWNVVGLVFGTSVAFSILNLQLVASYSTSSISRLVKQLVNTDKSRPQFFLKSLDEIAEFKDLRLVKPTTLEMLGCEGIYQFLMPNQVYNVGRLRKFLKRTKDMSPGARDAYEAAIYMLMSIGAEAFIFNTPGDDILVATPVALRSTRYFDSLLLWASQTLDLVSRANAINEITVSSGPRRVAAQQPSTEVLQ